MLPPLPDLQRLGIPTDTLVERILHFNKSRTSAIWVVRWRGRIRTIEGLAFFHSQEDARRMTVKWLRGIGRYVNFDSEAGRNLPRNWCYKKSYAMFIEKLAEQFENDGIIQYVQLEPGLNEQPTAIITHGET